MKCNTGVYNLEKGWFAKGDIKKCKANNKFIELSYHASNILRKQLGNIECGKKGIKHITDTELREELIKLYGDTTWDDKNEKYYFYFQEFANQVRDHKIPGISCTIDAGGVCYKLWAENGTEIKPIDCVFTQFIHTNWIFMAVSALSLFVLFVLIVIANIIYVRIYAHGTQIIIIFFLLF